MIRARDPSTTNLSVFRHHPSSIDSATITPEPEPSLPSGDEKGAEAEMLEPDVIDWDGPDDPQNPQNWPQSKKWFNIAVLSILSLITPLGSSMFAPGITDIMIEFNTTSTWAASFVISIYVLGFAFGPLIVAPLSEIHGRAPLYNLGNLLFTIFSVGGALSNSMGMLMAFRFLMGVAGSVPITIGSGTIADTIPLDQRGRAMALWVLGPLLGPSVGPVAGGYLTEAAGWRWVFWFQSILAGTFIPVAFFGMKETFAPVLLRKKAGLPRKETGKQNLEAKLETQSLRKELRIAIVRPAKLLFLVPIITLMAVYVAVEYGIMYLLFTTFPIVYEKQYGFNTGTSGLSYIPIGIGTMIGVAAFGRISDYLVKKNQALGREHKPEIRLAPAFALPFGFAMPAGLFIYGWTADKQVHWIGPMFGTALFGAGLMAVMMCVQNYLLDAYPDVAASVTAALTVLRSLTGAFLPLCGLDMYETLGLGWGNSLLGFISLGLVPIPLVLYLFGERIRKISNRKI